MNVTRLHSMVEQIARNFAALGHHDAVAATADHIAHFWDPRMKAAIFEADHSSLSPVASAAIERLAAGDEPPPQTRATVFSPADGRGRSDAG